jgi:hypothetical protein
MIPYSVIKESNPPNFERHSHRVDQFRDLHLQRSCWVQSSAWIMRFVSGAERPAPANYQTTFAPMLYGVALAIGLIFALKETGPAAHTSSAAATALEHA